MAISAGVVSWSPMMSSDERYRGCSPRSSRLARVMMATSRRVACRSAALRRFGPLSKTIAHTADHGVGLGIAEEVHLTDLLDQVPQLDDRAGVELALVLLTWWRECRSWLRRSSRGVV